MAKINRQEEIRKKGFNMGVTNYKKVNLGTRVVDDPIWDLDTMRKLNANLADKDVILQAISDNDIAKMRDISNYFYRLDGIYQKACNYLATMYRYDWYIVPEIYGMKGINKEDVKDKFFKNLKFLDNSHLKDLCTSIARSVIVRGVYYGYAVENKKNLDLQELPIKYCRSRYSIDSEYAVEFNMKFFDDYFRTAEERINALKIFPDEFTIGYELYRKGLIPPSKPGEKAGCWYLLDPKKAVKFTVSTNDIPILVNAIPAIIDLNLAQGLDRKKQMQQLMKLLIQKLPIDKNGDLIFDIDEAKDIHDNAVNMLADAIGVDIITTFADIDSVDISDKATHGTGDELQRVERGVYNSLGISQNLFNTDGNLSLEKSILNDAGSIRVLIDQFEKFFDRILQNKTTTREKYDFRLYILETTQYNYKELAKIYKEQAVNGNSKILPQLALGHTQNAILNTAYFENEILELNYIMIPPASSNTSSAESLDRLRKGKTQETKEQGRPEKEESEKSDKTLQNEESLN